MNNQHEVVIIGGGFGGVNAAKELGKTNINVTLIDKRNFHLFQPLLYQVATGGLSPGDIAYPLRAIFADAKNIKVLKGEVVDIDPEGQKVILHDGESSYDSLIIATGGTHHYFGNEHWATKAPGLKTIEDALEIRRRILVAFEAAEREPDPELRRAWLTFIVVGAGPTGVELAGTLAELTYNALPEEFRNIDLSEARIIMLEAVDKVLPPYPEDLSGKAKESLEKLGVEVQLRKMVTDIQDKSITIKDLNTEEVETILTRTVLWGAGMKATPMGKIVSERTGAELDRGGRVVVEADMSLAGHPNIFVIGDLANYNHGEDGPLPGLGAVAAQQGKYLAKLIQDRVAGKKTSPFKYVDKGKMSIIGSNSAVADINSLHFSGFFAWLIWVFVHIYFLIGFRNKVMVIFQWAWSYFTYKRGARLITNEESMVLVESHQKQSQPESLSG